MIVKRCGASARILRECGKGVRLRMTGRYKLRLIIFDVAFGGAFKVFFHKRLLFIESVLTFAQRDFDLDKRVLEIKF